MISICQVLAELQMSNSHALKCDKLLLTSFFSHLIYITQLYKPSSEKDKKDGTKNDSLEVE